MSPGVDFMDLAPFPRALAGGDSVRKLLLVSLRIQAFGAYEQGVLIRWGPISSGGPNAPSEPGLYFANWKDRLHVSTVDSTWIMPWTVNIETRQGTALHEYALPGRPVSHCCIRLMADDARWVFEWISTWTLAPDGRTVLARGAPVILFGEYDFGARPPWRDLAADPGATQLGGDDLDAALLLLSDLGADASR